MLLVTALAAVIALTTPWHPLPGHVPGGHASGDAARWFAPAFLARETAYHDTIRPWGLTGLSIGIVVPALLGFTPLGARLVGFVRPRRWPAQVAGGVLAVTLLTTLVSLPVGARGHAIQRDYGLTRQGWAGWWSDVARGYAVSLVTTLVVLLVVVGLARRLPRRWWVAAGAAGAALVVAGSFAYPYVVEPVFNNFHSLPAGPLRTQLLALATRDGQHLRDILVSDASRRTTTENAYVSGFGASKRLVLYDTLLAKDTPREIEVLTAHELGHSKRNDVLHGTLEGALGVAAAMCAAYLLFGRGRSLPRRVGATDAGDPRAVPLLIAAFVVVSFVISPVTNLVSRQIEARADVHSLELTHDPQTFISAQRKLAEAGLDDVDPSPVLYVLFFGHPSPVQRLAMAEDWIRQHPRG